MTNSPENDKSEIDISLFLETVIRNKFLVQFQLLVRNWMFIFLNNEKYGKGNSDCFKYTKI